MGSEVVLTMVSDDSEELRIWPVMTMNDSGRRNSTGERYERGWNKLMRGMGEGVNGCAHGYLL
jgi:hypothetical protein